MTTSMMLADTSDAGVSAWLLECGMGATQLEMTGKGKKRGSTSGGGRWEQYVREDTGGTLRWRDISAATIGECVQAVCANGDALLLGVVRGGGALAITICSGEQRYKLYANSIDEAEEHLVNITRTAEEKAGS